MPRTAPLCHDRAVKVIFNDRADAGAQLLEALDKARLGEMIVVGLARGGVPVAAEVARSLSLSLDALAVRKIGHPWQPEYGIGAVTPGQDGVYLRSNDGLTEDELRLVIAQAQAKAEALDAVLHRDRPPLALNGKTVLLVDDGLATGATMVAAVRWARHQGAARVVVALPVAATEGIRFLLHEADDVVCPHTLEGFGAVGLWYHDFPPVSDDEVVRLLDELQIPTVAAHTT